MRYHLAPVRMAIIQKSTNDKSRRGCGEKGTLLRCWWECQLVELLWIRVWKFLKKLKIELPYDPEIPLLGMYLEKNMSQKDTCTPMFTAALFTIARTWKQQFSYFPHPTGILSFLVCTTRAGAVLSISFDARD